MGPKLSRAPADHASNGRHQATVTSHAPEKTHHSVITGGQASSTTAGAPTSHNASAGLLAALRWKKLTHQRRGKRSLGDRSDKTTSHQPPQPALSTVSSNTGLWNKVIRHLSRKMDVGRHQRQRAGRSNTNDHTDGSKSIPARVGGTSSVLPVSRNPVTSVVAYTDNVGGDHPQHEKTLVDVNSNVADIVRRVSDVLVHYICQIMQCVCVCVCVSLVPTFFHTSRQLLYFIVDRCKYDSSLYSYSQNCLKYVETSLISKAIHSTVCSKMSKCIDLCTMLQTLNRFIRVTFTGSPGR